MKISKEELLAEIEEICAIIYYQSSLNDQDRWLEDKMVRGIWRPEIDEEEETRYTKLIALGLTLSTSRGEAIKSRKDCRNFPIGK